MSTPHGLSQQILWYAISIYVMASERRLDMVAVTSASGPEVTPKLLYHGSATSHADPPEAGKALVLVRDGPMLQGTRISNDGL